MLFIDQAYSFMTLRRLIACLLTLATPLTNAPPTAANRNESESPSICHLSSAAPQPPQLFISSVFNIETLSLRPTQIAAGGSRHSSPQVFTRRAAGLEVFRWLGFASFLRVSAIAKPKSDRDPKFESWLLKTFMPSASKLMNKAFKGGLTWGELRAWTDKTM